MNEAVCNAARYAKAGYENVRIYVDVEICPDCIKTSVTADTEPFDVLGFYRKMIAYGKDEKIGPMEWGDYTASTGRSRGFWMMLTSCRNVDIDIDGKKVTLIADRPFSPECLCKTVRVLIGRLRVVRGDDILDSDGNVVKQVEEEDYDS